MDNENPQTTGDLNTDMNTEGFMQADDEGVLNAGAPTVAATPGKTLLVVGAFILFLVFIFSLIFSDDEEVVTEVPLEGGETVAMPPDLSPIQPVVDLPPPVMPIPRPEPIPEPKMPIPIPPVPETPDFLGGEDADEALQERLDSEMAIYSPGALDNLLDDEDEETPMVGNDPNTAFANRNTTVGTRTAKNLGNLNTMIAQGKVIHAVLETAIDTQLPGQLRAIVSRDIYAESGKAKLIPKGSRLIGSYNTQLLKGQSRVFAIWTRVIRPDGIDIVIDSPGIDALGRSGTEGFVNSRYDEILSAAILSSVVSLATAVVAEDGLGVEGAQQTSNSSGTTSSESPKDVAAEQGINTINNAMQGIISDMLDVRQSIKVDQGTKLKVMVNKDLIFPANASNWMVE